MKSSLLMPAFLLFSLFSLIPCLSAPIVDGDVSGQVVVIHHDFGKVLFVTNLLYQWNPNTQLPQQIIKIISSCGCTTAYLKEGDFLSTNKPVLINVKVGMDFSSGEQIRSVEVETEDGNRYRFDMQFDWEPAPYSIPSALVFTPSFMSRDVNLYFPGETSIQFIGLKDARIKAEFTVKNPLSTPEGIGMSIFIGSKATPKVLEGILQIETTSKRQNIIRIPFLVLDR